MCHPNPPLGPPWFCSHLVGRVVLLAAAGAGLLVVLPGVDHLALGALPDQVSPDPGDILEPMAWTEETHTHRVRRAGGRRGPWIVPWGTPEISDFILWRFISKIK